MSHFTVMVFGKNVEEQLAPYNEQTEDKQFLAFEDSEDEYRQKYENEGVERVVMPDGRLLLKWDDEFKKPGAIGFGSNTHEVPEGLEIRNVPFKETYSSFEEFVKDWCGQDERDPEKGRFGYWRNPNSKWDWYQMGGRWAGYFRLKEKFYLPPQAGNIIGETGLTIGEISTLTMLKKNSPLKYAAVLRKYKGKTEEIDKVVEQFSNPTPEFQPGVRGNSGLMGANKHDSDQEGFADQTRKGDIDVEYMRMEAEASAREKYQKVAAVFAEGSIPKIKTWKEFLVEVEAKTLTIDDARKAYHNQVPVQMCDAAKVFDFFEKLDDYQVSEEEYVRVARNAAIVPFALVKDGKWFEKGEMGWWGCVKDEKEQDHWNEEFAKLFDAIPDDEIVTVVDCHI